MPRHIAIGIVFPLAVAVFAPLAGCGASDPDPSAPDAGVVGAPDAGGANPTGLASCAADGLTVLWNVDNLHGPITTMAIDPAGLVAVGSEDGSVKQWTIGFDAAGAPRPEGRPSYGTPFADTGAPVTAIALAAELVIAGDANGRARLWRVADAVGVGEQSLAEVPLTALAIGGGDRVLVAADVFGGDVRVWDHAAGTVSDPFVTQLWGVSALQWLPTGGALLAGHDYGVLSIERHGDDPTAGPADAWLDQSMTGSVRALALAGDRVIAAGDGQILVFSVDDLAAGPIAQAALPGVIATSVAVSPDGELFVTAGDDGQVRVWRVDDAALVGAMEAPSPVAVGVDGSGERVVVAGGDGRLRAVGCAAE